MIKINKNLNDIPQSLISEKTINKRQELINEEKYIQTTSYDKCYKEEDIKEKLKLLYNSKCCYCEKDLMDHTPHIEHYRPKDKYWWLAYSWDNLMLACEECNRKKSNDFEIEGKRRIFEKNDNNNIHKLSRLYNEIEKPAIINPEIEDVTDQLIFNELGEISSNDDRVSYTIRICGIDRNEANERRKKLWDDFKNEITNMIYLKYSEGIDDITINKIILDKVNHFYKAALKPETSYSAFRRYAIKKFNFSFN